MSVALITLLGKLQLDVPTRNDAPTEVQYRDAVMAAVDDFSRKLPLRKYGTLPVVSGTATYDLPADFYQMVQFPSLLSDQGVLNAPQGLIPVSDAYREETTIADGQITIIPTPNYTVSREYWYDALYLLDDDEIYQDLDRFNAGVAALKAQAICLRLLANRAASEEWAYQLGDERVDKKGLSKAIAARASELENEYLAAIKDAKAMGAASSAPYGRRSDYSAYLSR